MKIGSQLLVLCAAMFCGPYLQAETPTNDARPFLQQPTGNGEQIVFRQGGQLWQWSEEGGAATPLTRPEQGATHPSLSSDGRYLAYVGFAGSDNEVFVKDMQTGQDRRLTHDGGYTVKLQGWLNAEEILYSTTIRSWKRGPLLFTANMRSGEINPIPLMEASEGCRLGYDFIFVRNEELVDSNRQYQGGYAQRIYTIPAAALDMIPDEARQSGVTAQLLSRAYEGVSRSPVCLNDRVYFLSDRSGRYNIWSMTGNGDDLMQHTFDEEFDIGALNAFGPDMLIYERLGDLFVHDLNTDRTKPVSVALTPRSTEATQTLELNLGQATELAVSDDGTSLIAIIRGRLFQIDVAAQTATCVECASGVRLRSPQVFADGSGTIVALADYDGEYDLYRFDPVDAAGPTRIANRIDGAIYDLSLAPDDQTLLVRTLDARLFEYDLSTNQTRLIPLESRTRPEEISWSSNGRWATFVTYTQQDIGRITVYDTKCERTDYLTSGRYEVSSPTFSPDGDQLYYVVDANFRSSVIDTWGPSNYWPSFTDRSLIYTHQFPMNEDCASQDTASERQKRLMAAELPVVAGNYDGLVRAGNSILVYAKRAVRDDWGHLQQVNTNANGRRTASINAFDDTVFSYAVSTGANALVATDRQGVFVGRQDPLTGQFGQTYVDQVSGLTIDVDTDAEFAQMFTDLWRSYRDYFWDVDMAGVDWAAVADKYRPHLQRLTSREEFNELASYMIAELGAGHTTIGNPTERTQGNESIGKLGATFRADQGLVITSILDGDLDIMEERSPLSLTIPPVNVGDTITHVDGRSVSSPEQLDRILAGRAIQDIALTIQTPSGELRPAEVTTITAEHEAWLRAKHWASQSQRTVDRLSNGEVGYIRLLSSYEEDFSYLVRQYPNLHRKSGLILDLRGNNGGNIDPWILQFLQRRTWLYVRDRYDDIALKHPRESFNGNLVVLIDGDTYSDGELIAEGVRRLNLGVLVGTRTSGAGKWVNDDKTLIDGGAIRIPESGSYLPGDGPDQWVIEGRGVSPDVTIDNDPFQFFHGEDAQLMRAVDIAMSGPPG